MTLVDTASLMTLLEHGESYQPVFRGQLLEVEGCLPEVSARNLRVIMKEGLTLLVLRVVSGGDILFIFDSGDTYLATGLGVGTIGAPTIELAKFLAIAWEGKTKDWLKYLSESLFDDFEGCIYPEFALTGTNFTEPTQE